MVQAPLLSLQQASLLAKKERAQPAKNANSMQQSCRVARLFVNSTDPHALHCALRRDPKAPAHTQPLATMLQSFQTLKHAIQTLAA